MKKFILGLTVLLFSCQGIKQHYELFMLDFYTYKIEKKDSNSILLAPCKEFRQGDSIYIGCWPVLRYYYSNKSPKQKTGLPGALGSEQELDSLQLFLVIDSTRKKVQINDMIQISDSINYRTNFPHKNKYFSFKNMQLFKESYNMKKIRYKELLHPTGVLGRLPLNLLTKGNYIIGIDVNQKKKIIMRKHTTFTIK